MEVTPLVATLLIVLMVIFEHGISGQMHPSEGKNNTVTLITPSFRAYKLNKPKTTIVAKSRLTTKASNRPITTTKRIGQTTKPIKNQQLQKTTPKVSISIRTGSKTINKAIIIQPHTTIPRIVLYSPLNREYAIPSNLLRGPPPSEDTSPTNVTQRVAHSVTLTPTSATEDYEYYGNLTTKEWPELYDDLTASTEVPNTSTVEEVTRKRLKRRKTTTSDPATSTKRRLKRTRTTTVGRDNA